MGTSQNAADNVEESFSGKQQDKGSMSRPLTIIGNISFAAILLIMSILVFFLVQSRLSGGPPAVAGHQMYIVLSGSMQPAFDTGSLAFVRPVDPDTIKAGDIITFRSQNSASLTTHRVVELLSDSGLSFVTRGDANNVNDPNPVPAARLVGKMVFSISYVGYLMSFAQTKAGLISLVFIPALLIIFFEVKNLFKYANEMDKKEAEKSDKLECHSDETTKQCG